MEPDTLKSELLNFSCSYRKHRIQFVRRETLANHVNELAGNHGVQLYFPIRPSTRVCNLNEPRDATETLHEAAIKFDRQKREERAEENGEKNKIERRKGGFSILEKPAIRTLYRPQWRRGRVLNDRVSSPYCIAF